MCTASPCGQGRECRSAKTGVGIVGKVSNDNERETSGSPRLFRALIQCRNRGAGGTTTPGNGSAVVQHQDQFSAAAGGECSRDAKWLRSRCRRGLWLAG